MKQKHQIIIDNSVQWFSYVVKSQWVDDGIRKPGYEATEAIFIPGYFTCPFLDELVNCEMDFTNEFFSGSQVQSATYGGWEICRHDYARLKEILELLPKFERFNELIGL